MPSPNSAVDAAFRQHIARMVVLMGLATGAAAAESGVRIAVEDLPPTFAHPFRAARVVTAAIFDPLTAFDADGRLYGVLATGWENRDPLTWRFNLRRNVTFSNGAPLTADAVVAAIDDLVQVATDEELTKREVPMIASAVAVDGLTVDIVTVDPTPLLPRYVAAIMIPEPNQWRRLGREAFARQPVGTGPFVARELTRDRWRLAAATGAWRRPKVDEIEVQMVPDTSARVQALASRQVDIATVLGPDHIDTVAAAGGRMLTGVNPSVYGFTLITTRGGPLADRRVRTALNLAIDRKTIIDRLLGSTTAPANQPAARGVFGHDPEIPPYPFNRDAARRLLAEAGYPNGFAFTLDAPLGASASDTSIFQQVQDDLRAIGVAMTIHTMPNAVYLTKVNRTEFEGDAFPIAWPSWPSLDVWRALQVHSCLRAIPWYCDPAITAKMLVARSTWDQTEALRLRREIGRHYHDDAPALFLYELPWLVGLGPRIKSFRIANSMIEFHDIELNP
ncbi:MAG: hypothetical protein FJX59_09485 [Alphaproteobacteria bacterium]|nr:hypothetical protein [Alphaproteobacteria bacterium]